MSSPCSSCCLAKFTEWHWLQVLIILSRSRCQSSWVRRATSAAFTVDQFRRLSLRIEHAQGLKNRGAVGGPLSCLRAEAGGRRGIPRRCALRDCRPACGRSGRSARRRLAGSIPLLLQTHFSRRASRRNTSPTADGRSPCGRSRTPAASGLPRRRTYGACGRRRTAPRRIRCRSRSGEVRVPRSAVLSPILWHPPQPFLPSVMAIGCQWMVGIAFMAAQAKHACLS